MLYIVMSINWDYDDNYYSNRGYGEPVVAYKDIKLAEIECSERNIESFNASYNLDEENLPQSHWSYSIQDHLEYMDELTDDQEDKLKALGINTEDLCLSRRLNDQEIEQFLDIVGLQWYTITEVPDTISKVVYNKINKK